MTRLKTFDVSRIYPLREAMTKAHQDKSAVALALDEPPIHPGKILQKELKELDVKAAELSRQISVPANRLTQIMKGNRSITGDTALRLGHWFETDPHFWMSLQSTYDIRLAAQEAGRDIEALPTRNTQAAEQNATDA